MYAVTRKQCDCLLHTAKSQLTTIADTESFNYVVFARDRRRIEVARQARSLNDNVADNNLNADDIAIIRIFSASQLYIPINIIPAVFLAFGTVAVWRVKIS